MIETMLNKLRALFSLYRRFGLGWLLFRAGYALRMRLGILRVQFPAYEWNDRPLKTWLKPDVPSAPEEYLAWRTQHAPQFFFDVIPSLPSHPSWNPQLAVDEAEKILAGELRYFEHTSYRVGFPPDWHLDPHANIRVDARRHWSQIPDYGAYDIKFIWEASRFNQVYVLMRAYAFKKDERYPEAFWILVEDWARNNPPQRGPNWKCGQETSLRLLAWTFGLYAFCEAPASTPARRAQLTQLIAAQADRVYHNIAYAISTRGNHAMSEAFGLWLVGTLFPELKQSEKYRALGREILEREAAAHIFADGAYSMYSLNYHRFILHVYFLALRLGELNHAPFSDALYQSLSRSLEFMAQLIQPDGKMPVYGSNDGARVCPLDSCDFTDYRPTLQMGWYIVHGKRRFDAGAWDESLFWLWGRGGLLAPALAGGDRESPQPLQSRSSSAHESGKADFAGVGAVSNRPAFPQGGLYLLRGPSSVAFIRCTDFRERPSHADQLHVDLWLRGKHIAVDAGTYLYNGQGIWQNGLARTAVHNTVTVDDADQMLWLSRFTWGAWARGRVLNHDAHLWQGEHDGYARLGVQHIRTLLSLGADRWLVVDHLFAKRRHRYSLHWLLNDFPHSVAPEKNTICLFSETDTFQIRIGLLHGDARFSFARGEETSIRGWRSRYYGQKEPALSVRLETNQAKAIFWTFIGLQGDEAITANQCLDLKIADCSISVPLLAPENLNRPLESVSRH